MANPYISQPGDNDPGPGVPNQPGVPAPEIGNPEIPRPGIPVPEITNPMPATRPPQGPGQVVLPGTPVIENPKR